MSTEAASSPEFASPPDSQQPTWRPLDRIQRRVAGVLVEKAKTTPENYPLSLNAIRTACNQKSNRSPQMDLDTDDVEATLDELREMGAAVEIQGGSRVAKYKHCLYEWLGVDKVEMAVMAELLLRGAQTIGELRGRAARMEPIADLTALRPLLDSLMQKKLVISLTPAGRGQIVTHNLYQPQELAKVKESVGAVDAARPARPAVAAAVPPAADELNELRRIVEALQQEVEQLKDRLSVLES